MKRLNAKRAPWLRAAVVITLVACAFATLAGCTAAPKVEVESSQVQSDFEAFADTLSDNLVQSPYVDNGDYALTAFDVSDSHVADDGANVFDATATFENGSFRTTMDVVATYAKDGDSYTPSFEVSNTSTKAISGIKYDPQGTLGASDSENVKSIDFDEDAQTCTVAAAYEPEWFESVQGDVEYVYRFDGTTWAQDTSTNGLPAVSYGPLVATFDQYSADTDKGGCLTKVDIVSVDDKTGEMTANVTWIRGKHSNHAASAAFQSVTDDSDVSLDATVKGTLYSAPTEQGKHRVTATLTGTASNGKPMVVGIYAGGDQYSDDWTIFYKASVQADDAAYTCGSSISKKI